MQISFLLLAGVACVLSAPVHESEYKPSVPVVLKELTASAKIQLDGLPEGITRVWLQVKEINDLTGNSYEEGFEFAYNAEVDIVYYPELDSGKGNVFRMMVYGDDGWSQWSDDSAEVFSFSSRYELNDLERNWHDAKSFCLAQGKRLAMPKNEAQADKILEQYQSLFEGSDDTNAETAWIGLYDANYNTDGADSDWTWVDGTKLGDKFDKFEYGADMDSSIETAAVGLGLGGYWETDDPLEKHVFFCETLLRGQNQDIEAEASSGLDASILLNRVKRA